MTTRYLYMVDYKCFDCVFKQCNLASILILKPLNIMKKQSLKTLALNKNKVSTLTQSMILGADNSTVSSSVTGYPTSTDLSIIACTLACGGTTGPVPSDSPDCKDK